MVSCSSKVPRMGVVMQEMMHIFKTPDWYGYVGGVVWDSLMPLWLTPLVEQDQSYPGFLSPWFKMKLKYSIPFQYCMIHYWSFAIEESNLYNIKGYSESEYLVLIEYQYPLLLDNCWMQVVEVCWYGILMILTIMHGQAFLQGSSGT